MPGKWKVVFFWPKDFTFVCPTEIAAFGKLNKDFADRDAVVYGVSTDSEFVHLAWRQNHADLKALPFAMLADIKRELSTALGILDKNEGVCLRATFIVDPEGIIRFVSVNDLTVGRNPQEVLRVLDALQTDELCPCNWQKGDDVLKAAVRSADPCRIDDLKDRLPDYAKDLKLNLSSLASEQLAHAAAAGRHASSPAALAANHAPTTQAVVDAFAAELSPEALNAAKPRRRSWR